MKKLATDLVLPNDLILILIISSLSYFLGGIMGGTAMVLSQPIWGYLLEGIIGGFLLGLFLRRRYALWRTTLASTASLILFYLVVDLAGRWTSFPTSIAFIIGGLLAGAVFGGLLNARGAILIFMLICAAGFGLGQLMIETLRANIPALYDWIDTFSGNNGEQIFDFGLIGLVQGFDFGLALVLAVLYHRMAIDN
jgi:hypothetical protein